MDLMLNTCIVFVLVLHSQCQVFQSVVHASANDATSVGKLADTLSCAEASSSNSFFPSLSLFFLYS